MRFPDRSPVLDKNPASMGPEILSSTGAGVWGRLLRHFQTPVLYWINFSLREKEKLCLAQWKMSRIFFVKCSAAIFPGNWRTKSAKSFAKISRNLLTISCKNFARTSLWGIAGTKEWVWGSEIATQNHKSLAIFHRTLSIIAMQPCFVLSLRYPKPQKLAEMKCWDFSYRSRDKTWSDKLGGIWGEILVGRSAQPMKHENAQKSSSKISPNFSPNSSPGHKNLSPQF